MIQKTHDFQSKNGMARQWVCHPLWCKKVEDTEGSGDLKIGIRSRRLRTSDPVFQRLICGLV